MNYKIYIQSFNNFPIDDWAVSAYMGFKEKQADIYFFENIDEVPVSKRVILVALIEDSNKYLQKLGLSPKMALNIPEELLKYTARKIEYMTMKEFREDTRVPIFAKPNGKSKEFTAGVITKLDSKQYIYRDVPDDAKVLVSEVVNFVSEYRGYVIHGVLKGIKHYLGDFRIFPDTMVIDAAIADYVSAPAGYSIDFGITKDGRTLLIECNDGWSLGNYGLEDVTYSTLLAVRWLQLISSIPVKVGNG